MRRHVRCVVAATLCGLQAVSGGEFARVRANQRSGRGGSHYEQGPLLTLGNLARTSTMAGDLTNAIAYQGQMDALIEQYFEFHVSTGSERERLAFALAIAKRTDRTISLHLDRAPQRPDAAALAMLVLLQRKGRVLDAMADVFATVRRHADAADAALLDQLRTTTADLAHAALRSSADPPLQHRQRLSALEARKETLEAELSAHSAEFRAQTLPVTIETVQAAIPDDAALVELSLFRPFDPAIERDEDAYAPPHYAAYILRRHQAPVGFDLGPASVIDDAVEQLRDALRDPKCCDVKPRARALGRLVMQPLAAAIGDATRLLIAPDCDLNLVPFEAFIDTGGRYLIERYAVTYLTSGRDLLRLQIPRGSQSPPVIVASPLFGEPPAAPGGRGVTRSANPAVDSSPMYFAPLPSAAVEARNIKSLFPDAILITGREATEGRIAALTAPRLLHIASHGFFLSDKATIDNPLLRSGLALAGANLAHATGSDGLLTALEAAGLNLWGTELVTLSACDTGVGEVETGEGVYGLRRAFVLAGTETLVMSLWPVSDRVTRETMTAYCVGLRAGLGRGDALRNARRAMLARPEWSHPFFWASFIQSGEWAPLDESGGFAPGPPTRSLAQFVR